MSIDEQVAAGVAKSLRALQENSQALLCAPGPKALLRRFGEALHRAFAVDTFDCVRLSHSPEGRLQLKRRSIKVPGVEALSETSLAALTTTLAGMGGGRIDWSDGLTGLTVGTQQLFAAMVDDLQAKGGTMIIWSEPPAPPATGMQERLLHSVQREQLVRMVQNESRWLRKLDRTQARLYRDDLTGLYNYRYLEIALEHELRRAERFQNSFCLLFIDLDGFKPINDQHGHLSGSGVLKQVAEVLREVLREVDIPIRYGGDEFVVVLLGASCAKGVLAAERVRRRIEDCAFAVDGGQTHLTASIGVAAYPEHARDMTSLLRLADETMYSSKRAGKNRVTVVGAGATAAPEKGLV